MKDYEFAYVDELGRRLMKNKKLNAVEQKLEEVLKAKAALKGIWKCRDQEYRQLLELKALDREAERIGALTNAHRAFLDVAIVFVRRKIAIKCVCAYFTIVFSGFCGGN
jgi:hypothetical protein